MGVMRFLVPRRDRLAADAVERAYIAGLDEIPWQARIHWTDEGLAVERAESDSGNFFIPCAVDGHGEVVLSTASLMERPRPYHLHVELARGTLNRLRNQVASWELSGIAEPDRIRSLLNSAREHFAAAATRQDDLEVAAKSALAATGDALAAIDLLTSAYVAQVLATRHQQAGKLNTLLGVNLGPAPVSEAVSKQIVPAFNTALLPMVWRDIAASEGQHDWTVCDAQMDWCRAHGIKVCAGPLLQIDKWSLPDWMYLWGEDDDESFRACVTEHVEAVVNRYRGKVQLWICASRLNINNDFNQGEEARLRLAVLCVDIIRRADPRTPVVIMLDRPWASYMGRESYDLSPLHFADALVRADLGLAGIGLEINLGYTPDGTEPRDVLEFGRQLDRFSTLGLPLMVSVTVPGGDGKDPLARAADKTVSYAAGGGANGAAQRAWAEKFLPVLLAKQPVQGIIWNQLTDSQPHAFAHGGLFDAKDRAKPIVALLQSLRGDHLV